jgi:predicted N-formylglutamate amidohydrolase
MDGEIAQPPAVRVDNPQGSSRFVLLCEHASSFIPASYKGLGLSAADLKRHIAWDIGAAVVAGDLARRLDATLILAGYSRLLIDLNRPLGSATSIPEISESTVIPGNLSLTADERQHRAAAYFEPFQKGVAGVLDHRQRAGLPTTVIGIHSFTPVFKSVARPWHAGVLYRKSSAFGHALAEALGGAKANIAENEPYQIEDSGDYTVPVHGEARGLEAVLIEIRQDLIAEEAGAIAWAARLAEAAARLDWQR